jgi:hypothetical protein
MPYSPPQIDTVFATYTARFQLNGGTEIDLMFVDPLGMGTQPNTDSDFQAAVDALAAAGWTCERASKRYTTVETVIPS